jgi:hypothetical protein
MAGKGGPTNPWGLQNSAVKPGSLKTISDNKLATFAVGQVKKSRFQKAREEAEEKRRLEELETSKLYDSFVASFESDDSSKTFVRGAGAGRGGDDDRPGRSGDVYKLESRGGAPPSSGDRDRDRGHSSSSSSSSSGGGKPMKEMERMLMDFKVPYAYLFSSTSYALDGDHMYFLIMIPTQLETGFTLILY